MKGVAGTDLRGLVSISRYAGIRNDLVQAGGGNASVKLNDKEMLIKISGCPLSDLTEDTGYICVNYAVIAARMRKNFSENKRVVPDRKVLLPNKMAKRKQRASIETFLHAVTGKYTLHTHPLSVNALLTSVEGRKKMYELYPHAVFIPYRAPGIALAEEYFKQTVHRTDKNPVIFLENHGLAVSGDTAEEVIQKMEQVVNTTATAIGYDLSLYTNTTVLDEIVQTVQELSGKQVIPADGTCIENTKEMIASGRWNHRFCPDCVVYCGNEVMHVQAPPSKEQFEKHLQKHGMPVLLFYKNELYILCNSVRKASEIMNVLSFATEIQRMNEGKHMLIFDKKQVSELLNREDEKYRLKF